MLVETPEFIGLDTSYLTAERKYLRRIHLDSAASPLPAKIAMDSLMEFLPHYSNSHSVVHQSAKISTDALAWAHQQVLDYLDADPNRYESIFLGAGTTAAINRIARGLKLARPEKNVVLVSAMEHHANDLPHRQFNNQVDYIPLMGHGPDQGAIDLVALEALLQDHAQKVNYIAFSAVSNVTGIVNPIRAITKLAKKYDCLVLIDAAQAVAHINLSMREQLQDADFVVFSGHKIYCPTAPGVMVAKKTALSGLDGQDLGGGAVVDVSFFDYELSPNLKYKEQAGTPNIAGAIALARVLESLESAGRESIQRHSQNLLEELANTLQTVPSIRVYGDPNSSKVGALAFNHQNIDHGLLAAILNDYYMIAVRNECFCAHPYVSSLLKEELWQIDLSDVAVEKQESYINRKRGMVRASLGLYNTSEDINYLVDSIRSIEARIDDLRPRYHALADGNYQHENYKLNWRNELGWD